MILVFDLDDTLYNEIDFVISGFKSVSKYLEDKLSINSRDSFSLSMELLERNGRGKVFDDLLKYYGLYSYKMVSSCLSVYRYHKPIIKFSDDSIRFLNRYSSYTKYVVTDGNKIVQKNKIKSLNADKYFKKCIITHNYGIKFSKPNPYVFKKISEWEKTKAEKIIYIGDNPYKDFVGIKPLGFKTIRIINGMFAEVKLKQKYEAHITINSLDEIDDNLLAKLF